MLFEVILLCWGIPTPPPPRRKYQYFDVVVGLARSNGLESHAGCSVATARDRSKVMTQTKRDNLTLLVGGWSCGYSPNWSCHGGIHFTIK